MAHIQDRWYREVPDPENPQRKKRIPTARHGIGMRYKVRYLAPTGEERSRAFPDGQLKAAKEWRASVRPTSRGGPTQTPGQARFCCETSQQPGLRTSTWTSRPGKTWRCGSAADPPLLRKHGAERSQIQWAPLLGSVAARGGTIRPLQAHTVRQSVGDVHGHCR